MYFKYAFQLPVFQLLYNTGFSAQVVENGAVCAHTVGHGDAGAA